MPQAFEFSLSDVIVTWGPHIIDGAGDGNIINVVYDSPIAAEHEGAQGDVTVLLSQSRKGTATIMLGQASRSNDYFSAAMAAQRASKTLVKLPLTVVHKKGTSKAFARFAYVREAAELAFGMEHNNREWVLGLADLELFIGGNIG